MWGVAAALMDFCEKDCLIDPHIIFKLVTGTIVIMMGKKLLKKSQKK